MRAAASVEHARYRRAFVVFVVTVVVSGAFTARAADPADVPWGATEAMVRRHVPVDACIGGRMPAERVCSTDWSVGDRAVRAYFWFSEDRLREVSLVVPPEAFSALVGRLASWLGPPSEVTFERMKHEAVTFTNEVHRWRTATLSAVASRYELAYGGHSSARLRPGRAASAARDR